MTTNFSFVYTTLAVAALSLLASGCGTRPVPVLETHAPSVYEQHLEKDGLMLGLHPMIDKVELNKTFDMNLLDKGVLPILIVAENRSTSSSFIIAKTNLYVVDQSTGTTNSSHQKEVASRSPGTALGIAGGVIEIAASVPGAILMAIGSKMISDASVAQFGFADKEFYSNTLDPGEKASGFVYFQLPKGVSRSGKYELVAQVIDPSTGTKIPFEFPMNLNIPYK
jgi:hypothetical protein